MIETDTNLFGIRVVSNPHVPEGQFLLLQGQVAHVNPETFAKTVRILEYRRYANQVWHDEHPDVMKFIGETRPKWNASW